MKYIQLFESWHDVKTCPHCNGTGWVGPSKKRSIENIIKSGSDIDFLKHITDEDFVENAIDLFKETGITSVRLANLLAAMEPKKSDLDAIIRQTKDTMDGIKSLFDGDISNLLKAREKEEFNKVIKAEPEILSILDRIKRK